MKIISIFILFLVAGTLTAKTQVRVNQKDIGVPPLSRITDTTKNYQQPISSQGFGSPKEKFTCMSPEEIEFYNKESKAAKERMIRRLAAEGKPIPGKNGASGHVLLNWPMRISPNYDMQYKYFHKTNFVDQLRYDTIVVSDFNCGERTYDRHDASDISLWPFWWRMMDNQYVSAVAAAPGVISLREDGGSDRECTSEGAFSNRINILHDDGTTTRYHHLKKNSFTLKDTGDRVEAGEFLAYIGSSGRSSNPHLHFCVHDNNDSLIEPYYINDNCNNFGEETWWNNQSPYSDSKINRVMTHYAMPTLEFCTEIVNAKNNFDPGDPFNVGVYFTETQANDSGSYLIIKPNGDTFTNVSVGPLPQERQYYVIDDYTLPSTGNVGTWKVQANYRGKTYYHYFTVGCPTTVNTGGTQTGARGYIASSSITSSAKHVAGSNEKILYQAANEITFTPGFEAPIGIFLRTRLAGCGYAD